MNIPKSRKTIKFMLPALALFLLVGLLFAFKPERTEKVTTTSVHFIYQLSNVPVSDNDYESDANWVYSSSTPEPCETTGDATCFITVEQEVIDEYSGSTEEERLVNYLADQDGTGGKFASAIAAVNSLRGLNTKAEQ